MTQVRVRALQPFSYRPNGKTRGRAIVVEIGQEVWVSQALAAALVSMRNAEPCRSGPSETVAHLDPVGETR